MPGQRPGFIGTIEERFWRKVRKTDGCWEWTASRYRNGYGSFVPRHATPTGAHRFSWELHYGPVPDGLLVCHKCDNRVCVRPDHLFLGTYGDNIRDCVAKGRHVDNRWYFASRTHCKNGHPYPDRQIRGASRVRCEVCLAANRRRADDRKAAKRAANRKPRVRPTHCAHGHEWTPENTYTHAPTGARYCRECARISDQKRRRRDNHPRAA